MSVDFPAPFSPRSACTSAGVNVKSAPRSACTGPNRFWIPRSSRAGGVTARWGGVKLPFEAEPLPDMRARACTPTCLGRIVPGVDNIHAPLHRVEVGVMRSFAGDEGVEAGVPCGGDHVPGAAGDDPHPAHPLGSPGDEPRPGGRGPERMTHLEEERIASGEPRRGMAPDPDRGATIVAEPPLHLDPEPPGEHDVVAHLGVEVERDVRGVDRDVLLEQRADAAVAPSGDRHVPVPEEAVVNQQQGRFAVRSPLRRHRSWPAMRPRPPRCVDPARVLHLKPVDRVAFVGNVARHGDRCRDTRRSPPGGL